VNKREKAAREKLRNYGVARGIQQAPADREAEGAVHTFKEGPIARLISKRKG
jgi:hypothetical protein